MQVNPVDAFTQHVLRARPIGLNRRGRADYSGLRGRVQDTLSARTAEEQFTFDVALWYGYLVTHGGEVWKKEMVLRLFALLYYGGLVVNRGTVRRDRRGREIQRRDRWITWESQQIPICAAISHTARVLIWLPGGREQEFFRWLWGNLGRMPANSRWKATHGITRTVGARQIITVSKGRRTDERVKGVTENKSGRTCRHYGVNIALGGNGNTNPVSGKGIRENGKHGHLYIAVARNAFAGRTGILVGTEQSAPIDRQVAVRGRAGALKSVFRGINVPDQYGGGHGLGGHSRFSATGGDDFSYSNAPSQLEAYGPTRGNYYDGMYLELTGAVFDKVRREARSFDPIMIADRGEDPELSR